MPSAPRPEPKPERLTAGNGDPVVVVDFLSFSPAQRLSQLLCAHRTNQQVYEVDPVSQQAGGDAGPSLTSLAAGYAAALAADGVDGRRTVIVGYCSAAALALRIAEKLTARCEVVAVLVQPSWPDSRLISAEFTQLRANLGAQPAALPSLEGDSRAVLAELEELLRGDLRAMAPTLRLDESSSVLASLLARYRAWLGFLLASRNTLREPWSCGMQIHVLLDGDGDEHLPSLEPDSYQVLRLPFQVGEFVTNPALAEIILAETRAATAREEAEPR